MKGFAWRAQEGESGAHKEDFIAEPGVRKGFFLSFFVLVFSKEKMVLSGGQDMEALKPPTGGAVLEAGK